jgi:hypothetical protein
VIIGFIKAHIYNAAVFNRMNNLVHGCFKDRKLFLEESSESYLNFIKQSSKSFLSYRDSIRYTEFFRKNDVSVDLAAIHYFDFNINQFKRTLRMSHQNDIADLVNDMERGLDQMVMAHLNTVAIGNGEIGPSLSIFISGLDRQASGQTVECDDPKSNVGRSGES